MNLFGGKVTAESSPAVETTLTETDGVLSRKDGVKSSLQICVPSDVVISDINLASLKASIPAGEELPMIGSGMSRILQIFWLEQMKGVGPGTTNKVPKKVNKFLFDIEIPSGENEYIRSYLMMDVFYIPEKVQYIAKALGSYNSIPKVLSTNFQYKGNLAAERDCRAANAKFPLYSIDSETSYEKKANPLYFWMELGDLINNNSSNRY